MSYEQKKTRKRTQKMQTRLKETAPGDQHGFSLGDGTAVGIAAAFTSTANVSPNDHLHILWWNKSRKHRVCGYTNPYT